MRLTPKLFAVAVRRMLPVLESYDPETTGALARLCDRDAEITRDDAMALGVALLVELEKQKARTRAPRR
jgi:predicted transcriptional regulator